MEIESGPQSHREPEHIRYPLADAAILSLMNDERGNKDLFEQNPVLWLKGALALDTQRGPSEITNRELSYRYHNYGRYEWDPLVVKAVKSHLRSLDLA